MPSIHLLNKATSTLQPKEVSPGVWESGCWRVSVARAEELAGNLVYLHRQKSEPAFLVGTITSLRRELYTTENGNSSPRTSFIFTPAQHPADAFTSSDGWTQAGVKFIL